MGSRWKAFIELLTSLRQLPQSRKGIPKHAVEIQSPRGLVESPEGFHKVGVEFK